MAAVAERIKNVHPTRGKKISKNPRYVSDNLLEWRIKFDGLLWHAYAYRGAERPRELKGGFTSFRECERVLIQYLNRRNKFGRAIYPGSPFVEKVARVSRTDL